MSNEPTPQSAQSDINQAFEALRREVSLTRHAVEGLNAARERVPDYSMPLGQSSTRCKRWYLGRRGPNGQETQVGRQRLRADIEVLERRREFIVRLQELRTDIRTLATKRRIWRQRSRPTSRLRNADKTSLFSRTRLFFNEIVDEVIGHEALLSVVVNQAGHLDYRAELLDDAGIARTPYRSLLGHVPTTYRMAMYRNCVSNVELSLNDRTVR